MSPYNTLEQRMAQTYLDTFPDFVPSEIGVDIAAQREFHQLMLSLYRLAFDSPQLFVRELHEDDAYPNRFNSTAYGKPKLQVHMRRFTHQVDALLQAMMDLARGKESGRLHRKHLAILHQLGVRPEGPLPEGWVYLATRPRANLLAFSRCLFRLGYPYASNVFGRLLGDAAALARLESWLSAHGYTRYEALDGKASMGYANLAWDAEPPRAGFEYKVRHTGVSMHYHDLVQRPQVMGLCIPKRMMRACLERFDQAGEAEQAFMAAQTKRCDGCRYCVTTDRTGMRPLACIPVAYKGEALCLCPYFPGYRYCWTALDGALVDAITGMLSLLDRLRHSA